MWGLYVPEKLTELDSELNWSAQSVYKTVFDGIFIGQDLAMDMCSHVSVPCFIIIFSLNLQLVCFGNN